MFDRNDCFDLVGNFKIVDEKCIPFQVCLCANNEFFSNEKETTVKKQ